MHVLFLVIALTVADAFRINLKMQPDQAQIVLDKARDSLATEKEKAVFEEELKDISYNAQAVNAANFDSQLKQDESAFTTKYRLEPWIASLPEAERPLALREAAKRRLPYNYISQDKGSSYPIVLLGAGSILVFSSLGYGVHVGTGIPVYATGATGLLSTIIGAVLYVSGA